MSVEATYLHLADWRRKVMEMYAHVRRGPDAAHAERALWFRQERDCLFRTHPQSPLTAEERGEFTGLNYFPNDAAWRLNGQIELLEATETFQTQLPDGVVSYTRIARIYFDTEVASATLNLYWIGGYGGGLFLPFKDGTNGDESYGGGRYLYDTIKGADLGAGEREIVLDFNYSYNPSCAYHSRWICPLSPPENTLAFRVVAGEQSYPATDI
jgi:uncharacterized protein